MDRVAWWAALYGIAQSQTRPKWLSSSSSSSSLGKKANKLWNLRCTTHSNEFLLFYKDSKYYGYSTAVTNCHKLSGFSSLQMHSRVQLFATPWTATHQASLSITHSRSLLKLMSIQSVMPSSHLILCCPLLLLPSIIFSIRVFSSELVLCIRWTTHWSFSFSISHSNEHPGLISFRMHCFDLLVSKGLSRVFSNTAVQKH